MQTFIIIFVVSWIIPILFALVNIYRRMGKGSTIKDLFSKSHWPIYIPVFNTMVLILFIAMSIGEGIIKVFGYLINVRIK